MGFGDYDIEHSPLYVPLGESSEDVDWAQEYEIVRVEPKDLAPDSWLHEERFAEFLAAYQFAASHFSRAAPAFSKVTPQDAYWIWKTITTGFERNRRIAEEER